MKPETQVRHLLHVIPDFGFGGVPLRMVRIFNGLGRRYRHTIISLNKVVGAGETLRPDIIAELVPYGLDKSRPLTNLLAFHRTLRNARPDLLVTYNWGSIEWAMANCLWPVSRHVHHEAGFGLEEASQQKARRILLRRLALTRCLMLVVPSRTLERIALSSWHIAPNRILYIPNGIDTAHFARTGLPAAVPGLSRQPGEVIVGTVAPLRPEKNIGRLIRAFSAIQERFPARLVIAGEGAERSSLERLAASLCMSGRVVFLGRVAQPEQLLPHLNVFAISSETEQMPNAVLEAMASALPVAGTDVGDVKEMVAPENRAFIVARDDEAAFARAIATLLSDGDLRARLGLTNKKKVTAEFSQERMIAAYDHVFSL